MDEAEQETAKPADNSSAFTAVGPHRRYSTLGGSTGGLHLQDPIVGLPGAFRFQLGLDTFTGHGYLYDDDEVSQERQSLSVSWTPLENLELFGAIFNRISSTTRPNLETLAALGDFQLGAKLGWGLSDVVHAGAALRLSVLNPVGNESNAIDTTSVGLTAMMTADFRYLESAIPLVLRLNVDYLLDNSASLIDDIEEQSYDELADAAPIEDETRHLLSRFERFALGIQRVDMLTIGAGFEVPVQLSEDIMLAPLAEWTLGLPINRQDVDCAYDGTIDNRGRPSSRSDSCLNDLGPKAFPQKLTLGARFMPPVQGLSTFLAVNIGLTGTRYFAQESMPEPTYRVMFGAGYDYDGMPATAPGSAASDSAPTVESGSAVVSGRVHGTILDATSGSPIAGASVQLVGSGLGALATDAEGRFVSYALPPGAVVLAISHPNYDATQCAATIPAGGGETVVRCAMQASPAWGSLQGSLRDPYGAMVPNAAIQLVGPTQETLVTDARGRFAKAQLPPGTYRAVLMAPSYLARTVQFEVRARAEAELEFTVTRAPTEPTVQVDADRVSVGELGFVGDTTELTTGSREALAELTDLLLRNDNLKRIRIQAPGDGAIALTRALLLKRELVQAGVPEERIEALGGATDAITVTVVE